jgi:hypothetical protein
VIVASRRSFGALLRMDARDVDSQVFDLLPNACGDRLRQRVQRGIVARVREDGDRAARLADRSRSSMTTPVSHQLFKAADVTALGQALIAIADRYPLRFLTERDFFPIVEAYLHGRVPQMRAEALVSDGKVDFRIGQRNPVLLELVVAPRAFVDPGAPEIRFAGHEGSTQLYATGNKSELRKLASVPQSQARTRYLLLVDLRAKHDYERLRAQYLKELPRGQGHNPVRVVYATRGEVRSFVVGGGRRAQKGAA